MRCDRCEREATVHEVVIRQGQIHEIRLCERCATAAGLGGTGAAAALTSLVSEFVTASVKPAVGPATPAPGACPCCGATFSDLKSTGVLGCSGCYEAFEAKLGPLLERAQDGASTHVGKVPRRALAACRQGGEAADPRRIEQLMGTRETMAKRLATLREMLAAAVRAEQYERAAALRDEIERLGLGGEAG